MNSFRNRWISRHLHAALKAMPVVVLTGARQTGKTTLAQSVRPERSYFTLDDFSVLEQVRADPASLLTRPPVTLDEIQRVPDILLAIKRQVDRHWHAGDFLLTGSANLLLNAGVSDSLAGRAVYLELPPFCPREWCGHAEQLAPIDQLFAKDFDYRQWPGGRGDWPQWLLRGGFPPALEYGSNDGRDIWFGGYVQTYLERDLRQLSAVSSLPDFQRLMVLTAQRTGRILNQSELSRDAALAQATCHRHLNLLETGCLMTRLGAYAANVTAGAVKGKKIFWNDCGLGAWLAGIRSAADLHARADKGFWLEQAIFQSLQTWRSLDSPHRRVYYWRDHSGKEVDFILEQHDELVALEVKSAGQVTMADTVGLRTFGQSAAKRGNLRAGVVLHSGEARPLGANLYALPWNWLVPAVS